ncbi:MAG: PSD1 domain-containing protein [Verrucomicrobia bacterium]|nr:PSD1 domain-containing protein [Verrucomicrobiota bacterium]
MKQKLSPSPTALRLLPSLALLVASLPALALDQKPMEKPPTPDQLAFFEKKIRPVLVAKCYKCHAADSEKIKGGLVLDTREGIRRGGDTGHAVVPGSLTESLLVSALRGVKKAELMPPKEKLTEDVIADFEKWILMGAPDPRDGTDKSIVKKWNVEDGKSFWAFQPVKPQAAPKVKDSKWPASDVDRFVLAKLEEKNLKPVADATPHALIRRVYFDLIGIPPTPEQVEAFVKDSAGHAPQAALEKVVDQLLASPQFGERWGRHWLDVARYAESTGRERNYTYTQAWRYRDYVIASLNADKPYDQFIREQIAGDLLPSKNFAQRNEQTIATGFLALGPKGLNERNREQFVADNVDEQIDTTTRAVMAVTVSCARCHDHKFDPITTRDYYAVAGIFKSTENCYGTGDGGGAAKNRQPGRLITLAKDPSAAPTPKAPAVVVPTPAAPPSSKSSRFTPQQETMLARLAASSPEVAARFKNMTDDQKAAALERLQGGSQGKFKGKKAGKGYAQAPVEKDVDPTAERAMGVQEGRVADAPIYLRGEVNDKGAIVPRGVVQVLATTAPVPKMPANQSGRLELAQWLTAPENPLTARVMANRVWQHLLGEGIVATADNFGATGERPTHPELLDYLAGRLVANGWSVKKLIREVVLSRTYQLSSANDAKNFAADPDNNLLWHANQRRLDAEAIRDAALAVGGQLDLMPPHGSPITAMGDTDIGRNRGAVLSTDSKKRSVYLPIVREMVPPVLDLFDFAEPSLVVANRDVTTVPSQALFMLNSPFIYDNSAQMAKRLLTTGSMDNHQLIKTAYLTALSRTPTAAELSRAETYLQKHTSTAGGSRDTAWATFCQALLASAEFRYIN